MKTSSGAWLIPVVILAVLASCHLKRSMVGTRSNTNICYLLDMLRYSETENAFLAASNAVARTGTNAVPFLIDLVRARADRVPVPAWPAPAVPRIADLYFSMTNEVDLRIALGCYALGPLSGPVVKELAQNLYRDDVLLEHDTINTLIAIGPQGFLPLIKYLSTPHEKGLLIGGIAAGII
jgi:hypothetical protein